MTRDQDERISGYLDGELSAEESAAFEEKLARSPELRKELEELRAMKNVTDSMKLAEFPDRAWDDYWRRTYNRMERRIGWIFLSIGAMILLGAGLYEMVVELFTDNSEPWWVRVAIGSLVLGLAILFVSVVRERFFSRRHDPYREVQR